MWNLAARAATAGLLAAALAASLTTQAASATQTTPKPTSAATDPPPLTRSLGAVSCPTPKFCLAVGPYGPQTGDSETFSQTWNTKTWTTIPVPSRSPSDDLLVVLC
jgi:hypothetical protein